MFADDMAAGADTLEELFEIYKALVVALDKAGIQVKASKVEFGVEEITFTITASSVVTAQWLTPPPPKMRRLTRFVTVRFLYIWNKDNSKHLFQEVDSSDEGWGACAYQYANSAPEGEDEGKHFLLSKKPKRIIQWITKVWTPCEKKSLPIFYKETIARILSLEQFRNLIETQSLGSGTTCYSDHLPGIKSTSLRNKGKLSTWKLHETSDLTSIVTTLYKSGPTMAIADPLSRLSRQEHRVDNLDLPLLLEMLLTELPDEIRDLEHFRVNAEKDTNVVTRIV
jgi:hypothetical protein